MSIAWEKKRHNAAKRDAYFAFKEKRISETLFRARMKELAYSDDEIDIYVAGDIDI